MKTKMRKYEEGGDIESTQGQNPGIDDDGCAVKGKTKGRIV